ncbi:MAG TPA: RNA methyltransferase [Nocardioidaceae bacterium]|nr:RNA methyltransferase [Nocardioidaceae bacterium]
MTARSGRVRQTRRLLGDRSFRRTQGEFVAEGPQAVREALGVDGSVREVFADPEASERHADLRALADRADVAWHVVDAEVVAATSQTVHPQGMVARCGFVDVPLATLVERRPRLVAVCADIRDPGNAGSVLRCADAAGAEGIVFTGDAVDPYNPKAVRSSVGSLFHLDLVIEAETAATIEMLRAGGMRVVAADASAELDLDTAADDGVLDDPTAWLFGNEAWGLPVATRDLADVSVRVPIHGRAESLNLAAAAAVCLYASARAQRRRPKAAP